MLYVGVDGSKGGWFAVALNDKHDWKVDLFPTIRELWDKYSTAELILVDIPIGLLDDSTAWRLCDLKARELLGTRCTSVFMAPCRQAFTAKTHEEASYINKDITGKGLAIQTWSIMRKIKEVDDFLAENKSARQRILEVHPELCFWAFNNKQPVLSKKKEESGIQDRRKILQSHFSKSDEIYEYAMRGFPRNKVGIDDIIDATVVAITALRYRKGLISIPEQPQVDSTGLPMKMVFTIE